MCRRGSSPVQSLVRGWDLERRFAARDRVGVDISAYSLRRVPRLAEPLTYQGRARSR